MEWSPELTFAVTYIAAALSGLAVVLLEDKPLRFRTIIGTILLYGGLGSGLGMVGYEYLGGKNNPWKVVACGMLVGVRAIKMRDITNLVRRILAISDSNDPPKD